jgi:hypothetical protein
MKKIFSIFALAALFLTSCSEVEEPNLGLKNQWLQFDKTDYTISEGAGTTIKIPVMLAGSSNPNGLDVKFNVTSTSPTAYTIAPSNGVLRIEPGKFVAYIEVTPVNNDLIADDVVLDFTFGDNAVSIGLAGENRENKTTKLTIIEDDCPFDVNEFVGTYRALEEGYLNTAGEQVYYDVVATLGTGPDTIVLKNLWDVGGSSTATLDFSNPASPRITFKTAEFLYTNPTYGAAVIVDPKDLTPPDLTNLSTFKTCSKEMDLYFYVAVQAGLFPKVHISLTKK